MMMIRMQDQTVAKVLIWARNPSSGMDQVQDQRRNSRQRVMFSPLSFGMKSFSDFCL